MVEIQIRNTSMSRFLIVFIVELFLLSVFVPAPAPTPTSKPTTNLNLPIEYSQSPTLEDYSSSAELNYSFILDPSKLGFLEVRCGGGVNIEKNSASDDIGFRVVRRSMK